MVSESLTEPGRQEHLPVSFEGPLVGRAGFRGNRSGL